MSRMSQRQIGENASARRLAGTSYIMVIIRIYYIGLDPPDNCDNPTNWPVETYVQRGLACMPTCMPAMLQAANASRYRSRKTSSNAPGPPNETTKTPEITQIPGVFAFSWALKSHITSHISADTLSNAIVIPDCSMPTCDSPSKIRRFTCRPLGHAGGSPSPRLTLKFIDDCLGAKRLSRSPPLYRLLTKLFLS